ncbi:hypothetical protein PMAYCL1PPCAC_21494, partial [Pristionchus mayeri]
DDVLQLHQRSRDLRYALPPVLRIAYSLLWSLPQFPAQRRGGFFGGQKGNRRVEGTFDSLRGREGRTRDPRSPRCICSRRVRAHSGRDRSLISHQEADFIHQRLPQGRDNHG